jgi:hypothetical protein
MALATGILTRWSPIDPISRIQLHDVPTRGSPAIAKLTHKVIKDDAGKMRMATVNTVTTIVVSGSVWAYRPQAK